MAVTTSNFILCSLKSSSFILICCWFIRHTNADSESVYISVGTRHSENNTLNAMAKSCLVRPSNGAIAISFVCMHTATQPYNRDGPPFACGNVCAPVRSNIIYLNGLMSSSNCAECIGPPLICIDRDFRRMQIMHAASIRLNKLWCPSITPNLRL